MACRLYNTERCLQHQLFNRPNFGVHFNTDINYIIRARISAGPYDSQTKLT